MVDFITFRNADGGLQLRPARLTYRIRMNDEATFHGDADTACAIYDEACGASLPGDVVTLDVWSGVALGYVATLERRA